MAPFVIVGISGYLFPSNQSINAVQKAIFPPLLSLLALLLFSDAAAQWTCGDTLTDPRDGRRYPTVQIGSDCWMAENLNVGNFATSINTGAIHSDVSNNAVIEKYCWQNVPANCDIYGGLYDWDEAMDYQLLPGVTGICPPGWILPTVSDFLNIQAAFPVQTGLQMKMGGASGFEAGLWGDRISIGGWALFNNHGFFWTSDQSSATRAWEMHVQTSHQNLDQFADRKEFGFYVRCVLDILLPENRVEFRAEEGKHEVQLSWQYGGIRNLRHFVLERSPDRMHFHTLANIDVDPDGLQMYDFTDPAPLPGLNYYRLRLVEADGDVVVTKWALVQRPAVDGQGLLLYPQPAVGRINVRGIRDHSGPVTLRVFDLQGRMVLRRELQPMHGEAADIDVGTLKNGLYVLRISGDAGSQFERLLIR